MKALAALAALTIAASALPAAALPGQTTQQFKAWAKSNAALHGMKQTIEEMSGMPIFLATFRTGSLSASFSAAVDGESKISGETLAIEGIPETHDILKHAGTAHALLAAVYGDGVAGDLDGAPKLGSWIMHGQTMPTAMYRGKVYGYELANAYVKLLPLSAVGAEVKQIESCITSDCGD